MAIVHSHSHSDFLPLPTSCNIILRENMRGLLLEGLHHVYVTDTKCSIQSESVLGTPETGFLSYKHIVWVLLRV